jgi:hypothetical protein
MIRYDEHAEFQIERRGIAKSWVEASRRRTSRPIVIARSEATKQSSGLWIARGACHRAAPCADPLARNDVGIRRLLSQTLHFAQFESIADLDVAAAALVGPALRGGSEFEMTSAPNRAAAAAVAHHLA